MALYSQGLKVLTPVQFHGSKAQAMSKSMTMTLYGKTEQSSLDTFETQLLVPAHMQCQCYAVLFSRTNNILWQF